MDLGSVFLVLALLVLVGLFVSRPLFEGSSKQIRPASLPSLDDHDRSTLLAERDRLLTALEELDFDQSLGKIPEEDYPQQRAILLRQGAEVLRRLDTIQPGLNEADVEARMEAAIAARRAETQTAQGLPHNGRSRGVSAEIAAPDDDLEILLAQRRRDQQEKAAGFCHKCGGPLKKSDQFCPKCGAKIS